VAARFLSLQRPSASAEGLFLFFVGMITAHLLRCGSPCIVVLISPSHFSGLRANINGSANVGASNASTGCRRVVWICGGAPTHCIYTVLIPTRIHVGMRSTLRWIEDDMGKPAFYRNYGMVHSRCYPL